MSDPPAQESELLFYPRLGKRCHLPRNLFRADEGFSGETALDFCILEIIEFFRDRAATGSSHFHGGCAPNISVDKLVAWRASFRDGGSNRGYFADVFPGSGVRPRYPVSSRIVDGCCRPMARRNFLSQVGGVGQLGFRRTAIYILSTCVVDGWRGSRLSAAMEARSWSAYLVDARRGRHGDVEAGARVAPGSVCHGGRCVLRCKSIQPDYRLLPQ